MAGGEVNEFAGQPPHRHRALGRGRLVEVEHYRKRGRGRVAERVILRAHRPDRRVDEVGVLAFENRAHAVNERHNLRARDEILVEDVGLARQVVEQIGDRIVHGVVARDQARLA